MTTPIPQPPAIPFLGNINNIEDELPIRSFLLLAQQYGEIYQLNILGTQIVHINSHALVQEVSDEKRFRKRVAGALNQVRNLAGDGLFTAHHDEPNWGIAHRVLMPAFGTANVRNMFDDMVDIASQLLLKWERFGPEAEFDPTEDFTRLTFDTIALCSMGTRFNSFYTKDVPPFIQAMVNVLIESGRRNARPSLIKPLMRGTNAKYEADIKYMTDFAQKIVSERRTHPTEKKDLLTLMLEGKDPKTGESLPDKSIVYNLITFLIAGHETTSGMLAFTTYHLLKNPEALRKLRAEIDEVCGEKPIQLEHLSKMPYLVAVMRESLRLSPTAPVRGTTPIEDTTLANGKYFVKKDTPILIHATMNHTDPAVWGDDARLFRPERMLDGEFEKLPPHAWQPFGFGMRACIGRPFAWQEAQLVLASVFQKFDLYLADPSYDLEMKQSLTIKPKGLKIRAVTRSSVRLQATGQGAPVKPLGEAGKGEGEGEKSGEGEGGRKLTVLYGSNTGTCEAFAQRVAAGAAQQGFKAHLSSLDEAAAHLKANAVREGPTVIITASFEGEPADNAAHFVEWLSHVPKDSSLLKGVPYTVFGCGNHEWARTYQRIPRLIDDTLAELGAERVLERGEGDAADASFFQKFDEWEEKLWEALGAKYGAPKSIKVDVEDTLAIEVSASAARAELFKQLGPGVGKVLENRLLTKEGVPSKRHIRFELSKDVSYRAGDYLAILPTNPPEAIHRALARYGLLGDQEILIKSGAGVNLPVGKPILAHQLFSGYFELSQPATQRDLKTLLSHTTDEDTKVTLTKLLEDYQKSVLEKRVTVLDLLEEYPKIDLPLHGFIKLLPSMRIRQYSISSTPLVNPEEATLTVSVLDAPALSGKPARFLGVASNYLSHLVPGERVHLAVRSSGASFHPPSDIETPIVLFCAGSGLAPFRGFVEERAVQKRAGREVGKVLLFFGCRHPEEDYLYGNGDLKLWEEEGVVSVRTAFSRKPESSEGCKYVQHRILKDRQLVHDAYAAGAKFYTCGSRHVANGVKDACVELIREKSQADNSEAAALEAFERVQKERYATDIFD